MMRTQPFHRARRRYAAVALSILMLLATLALGGCGQDEGAAGQGDARLDATSLADTTGSAEGASDATSPQAQAASSESSEYADNAQLVQAVTDIVGDYGEDISVAYVPLGTDSSMPEEFEIQGSVARSSASMIKVPILAALLEQVDAGQVSLDEELTMRESDIVDGTGVIGDEDAGTSFTIRELATHMIRDSDNTATNMLIDRLGMDEIDNCCAELGLDQTTLGRKMMDLDERSTRNENRTSAHDLATLFDMIASGTLVDEQQSKLALDLLEGQNLSEGLDEGVPEDVAVAHKTGTLSDAVHDGGIIEAEHPYVLVVMTEDLDEDAAIDVIEEVSQTVYQQTNGISDDA